MASPHKAKNQERIGPVCTVFRDISRNVVICVDFDEDGHNVVFRNESGTLMRLTRQQTKDLGVMFKAWRKTRPVLLTIR
jgi:hypothetical protein